MQATCKERANYEMEAVPFYVLPNGKVSKALFTVPADVADQLIAYPVLCRGSSFTLTVGADNSSALERSQDTNDGTGSLFLEANFHSPCPDEVAEQIAIRLATRIENSCSFSIADVLEI